jgi:hypothetical protein
MIRGVDDVYYSRSVGKVTTPIRSSEDLVIRCERDEKVHTGYLIDRPDPILEI